MTADNIMCQIMAIFVCYQATLLAASGRSKGGFQYARSEKIKATPISGVIPEEMRWHNHRSLDYIFSVPSLCYSNSLNDLWHNVVLCIIKLTSSHRVGKGVYTETMETHLDPSLATTQDKGHWNLLMQSTAGPSV